MRISFSCILFVAIVSILGCNDPKRNGGMDREEKPELELLGRDIYEVRAEFLEQNFYVSTIVDSTGKGEQLSMTVDLDVDLESFVATFGYVTGIDLAPWQEEKVTHLRVRASMEGEIVEVQLR